VDERPGTVQEGKGYRISVEIIQKYKRNRDEKKTLSG
jgi:hypothetical protein